VAGEAGREAGVGRKWGWRGWSVVGGGGVKRVEVDVVWVVLGARGRV
jgi:hypothetical protein